MGGNVGWSFHRHVPSLDHAAPPLYRPPCSLSLDLMEAMELCCGILSSDAHQTTFSAWMFQLPIHIAHSSMQAGPTHSSIAMHRGWAKAQLNRIHCTGGLTINAVTLNTRPSMAIQQSSLGGWLGSESLTNVCYQRA